MKKHFNESFQKYYRTLNKFKKGVILCLVDDLFDRYIDSKEKLKPFTIDVVELLENKFDELDGTLLEDVINAILQKYDIFQNKK